MVYKKGCGQWTRNKEAKLPLECTVASLCNADDHKLCMLTKTRSSAPCLRICNVYAVRGVRLLINLLDIGLKVGLNTTEG